MLAFFPVFDVVFERFPFQKGKGWYAGVNMLLSSARCCAASCPLLLMRGLSSSGHSPAPPRTQILTFGNETQQRYCTQPPRCTNHNVRAGTSARAKEGRPRRLRLFAIMCAVVPPGHEGDWQGSGHDDSAEKKLALCSKRERGIWAEHAIEDSCIRRIRIHTAHQLYCGLLLS